MKLSPVNIYVSCRRNINLRQQNATFKGKEAQRTSEPNLNTYIPLMNNKMKLNDNIRFFLGALGKIDTDEKRKKQPLEIADIGCCDGALARTLREFLPSDYKYFGLDLSPEMLEIARAKDASDEYNEEAYSKASILHFMQQAYDSLKPGGVLIIKDPATPGSDAWEKIRICNANEEDGTYPPIKDEEELRKADITKLCTLDKLKRFCMDFYPAKGQCEWEGNSCIMPRWLITEFVRHRKWLATPENWAYEIKENYGTMRPDEMADFASRIGFNVIKIENISIPNKNNIYAIREGEFELKDMNDNDLSLEDFPMFLEVVLRKPRQCNN